MDLETTVKVLEGLVHITVLIFFGAAVWGLIELTANRRASTTVTVVNEIGQAIAVRCPGVALDKSSCDNIHDEYMPGWERMQKRGIRDFTFRGSIFGTPTIWCYVNLLNSDQQRASSLPAKCYCIYKSGNQRDAKTLCRLTKEGAYVDDVLKPGCWTPEELKNQTMTKLHEIADSAKHGRRHHADVLVPIGPASDAMYGEDAVALVSHTDRIILRCNDGPTFHLPNDSPVIRMSRLKSIAKPTLPRSPENRHILLRMVNGVTFEVILAWCNQYKDDPEHGRGDSDLEAIPPFDWSLLVWNGAVLRSDEELDDIIVAAIDLRLTGLLLTAAECVRVKRNREQGIWPDSVPSTSQTNVPSDNVQNGQELKE